MARPVATVAPVDTGLSVLTVRVLSGDTAQDTKEEPQRQRQADDAQHGKRHTGTTLQHSERNR